MASIVPSRTRSSRPLRRLSLIAAGVATSLVLMGASLAALTGNVLSVTHWSSSHEEATKGQILPEIPSRPAAPGVPVATGGQPAPSRADEQAAATPPAPATAAPTPLPPVTGGVAAPVSAQVPTGAGDEGVSKVDGTTAAVPAPNAAEDNDGDGLTNEQERKLGTDPARADTDGDGLPDGWEARFSLDPLNATDAHRDGDRDGVDNRNEFLVRSNPVMRDSNRDGIEDGDDDPDGDGVPSAVEQRLGLDPAAPVTSSGAGHLDVPLPTADVLSNKPSSVSSLRVPDDGSRDNDGDGLPNALEVQMGLDPASATTGGADDALGDYDGDGLANALEIKLGVDPTKADTDDDGISDPADDSDGDGLPNSLELGLGLDPTQADTDGNGTTDGAEDSDADGVSNAAELAAGTDPGKADQPPAPTPTPPVEPPPAEAPAEVPPGDPQGSSAPGSAGASVPADPAVAPPS